jgi:hypothetical protein
MKGSETVLARFYAMQAVKQSWREQGLRPQYMDPHEIGQAARLPAT